MILLSQSYFPTCTHHTNRKISNHKVAIILSYNKGGLKISPFMTLVDKTNSDMYIDHRLAVPPGQCEMTTSNID